MTIYYHGTGPQNIKYIFEDGIKLGTSDDNTFGPGLYVCEKLEDAQEFGMVVLAIEVDDSEIQELSIEESEIAYEDLEWGENFATSVLESGHKIAKIVRDDGFEELVIYDLSCVIDVKEEWRSPLLK
jgi:hypothetical protein